ncbi:MAG: hypothetical protein JWP63_3436 [Candidatus Solibacter sp.]|nr:hypothetical protein [Candidatus Solibacter sp.]
MQAHVPPLLLLAFTVAAQDRPTERCTLSGTVVNSVTGEPLNKVELILGAVERSTRTPAGAITDSEGRFTMIDLDPHRQASRLSGNLLRLPPRGRQRRRYPSRSRPNPHGPQVETRPLRRHRRHHPRYAYVSVARLTYEYGKPRLESYTGTDTDDLGQYRVRDLAPGKYVVGVRPATDSSLRVDHSPTAPRENPVPTVYPGSADLSLGTPVEVPTGARITGIDITLARAHTFTIKGRVVTTAGAPVPNAPVALSKRDSTLHLDRSLSTVSRSPNGDFELRGVQAGAYLLTAQRNESQVGMRPLDVSADLEGVVAVLGPASQVRAKFSVEGDAKLPSTASSIFLNSDDRRGYFLDARHGNLLLSDVAPGVYQVRLYGQAPGYYVKSIRSGEIDVLSEGLTVTSGATSNSKSRSPPTAAKSKASRSNKTDSPSPEPPSSSPPNSASAHAPISSSPPPPISTANSNSPPSLQASTRSSPGRMSNRASGTTPNSSRPARKKASPSPSNRSAPKS